MNVQIKVEGLADLQSKLKARGDAMITRGAENTAKFMYDEFERAIAGFYDSYSPISYHRHYNMSKGGQAYTRGYKSGLKFGGVKLNSNWIPEDYHDSASYVFNRSTMEGWHGGVGIFSTPSPMNVLMDALEAATRNIKVLIR